MYIQYMYSIFSVTVEGFLSYLLFQADFIDLGWGIKLFNMDFLKCQQ